MFLPPPALLLRLSHTSPSGRASFEMSITAGTPIFQQALGDDPLWEIW